MFSYEIVIFLRKTTRPTGKAGRYDYSPADGFTHATDMLFFAAKDGK